MTEVTIPDIVLRTTSDGAGFSHGLAVGTGGSVDQAVANLMDEARRQAEEIELGRIDERRASRTGGRGLPIPAGQNGDEPGRWYEVVDVRLTRGHSGGGDASERWCAYGTLRSTHRRPGSGGYWDAGSAD